MVSVTKPFPHGTSSSLRLFRLRTLVSHVRSMSGIGFNGYHSEFEGGAGALRIRIIVMLSAHGIGSATATELAKCAFL